ncbi:citron Rho-interacting kinase-like isoform X2 [Ornithodoros turicata]|uniref:citron Rho-interacting kinase-like isoform X2 n=1 Tax=Ornithodoros turicata TaxID=34597 RepID=UPI003139364D
MEKTAKREGREAIAVRSSKLSHLVLGRGSVALTNKHLVSRDSLLDALLTLYEECNTEQLKKEKNVSLFLDKYRQVVAELRQLRVSIADFEVKKIIGRGHFGEVQMVKERATGDTYAMKVLRKADTLSQQNVAFYEEERDILARASQGGPWLTKLQYAFQDSSHLYMVMEFLPGGDLLGLLDRHDNILPEEIARFYLAEITLAVHALHSLGYVHRDVKPDNILIDRTGHIKLADFGSAAKLTSKMSVCSRMPVGTPDYIAPEVLRAMDVGPGSTATYGMGCDWWSLGVVAYEILFGQLPFSDDRTLITYNNIMNFKKSLKFPEDPDVSESAVGLMKGLLDSADKRLSYDEICQHPFFANVNWNEIRKTVPPFVPNLDGADDTSNFDDFKQEGPRPRPVGLRDHKKSFDGANLPFVGFTHTMTATGTMTLNRTASLLDVSSPLRTSFVDSDANRKRQEELQDQIAVLTEKEERLRQESHGAQARLKESVNQVAMLESELATVEKEVADLRSDNQNLNSLLSIERKKRVLSEENALQLLEAIKRKYRRQDELLRSGCLFSGAFAAASQETHGEDGADAAGSDTAALQEQLTKLDHELSAQKKMCSKYREQLNLVLAEGSVQEVKMKQKNSAEYVEALKKQAADALEKQQLAEEQLTQGFKHIQDLKDENANLKQQLESSRNENGKLVEHRAASASKPALMQDANGNCAEENLFRGQQDLSNLELSREIERLRSVVSCLERTSQSARPPHFAACGDAGLGPEEREREIHRVRDLDMVNSYIQEIEQLKSEIKTLKEQVTSLTDAASKTDDEKSKMVAPEVVAALERELSKTKEFLATSRRRCADVQQQLGKHEDQLSKAQMESRIAQRESARAKDSERVLREKASVLEKEVDQAKANERTLQDKVANLEDKVQRYEQESAGAKLTYETTKDLAAQCVSKSDECRDLSLKCQMLQGDLKEKTNECGRAVESMKAVKEELANEQAKTHRMLTILESLKSSCEVLEDQVNTYEELLKQAQQKNAAADAERAAREDIVCSLNHKIEELEEMHLKERSARMRAEEHLAEYASEQESHVLETEEEMGSLRKQLEQKEAMLQEMSKKINELQKELGTLEASFKALRRANASLQEENTAIKEEASCHMTTIASLKSSNFKLSHELEEASAQQKRALECIEQLEGEYDGQKSLHETEMIKLKQTLAQQTKLIDFLQAKVSETDKKKKKFFGGKARTEPVAPPRWTDAEKCLDKERSKCRRLQEQLEKAKAEVMTLRDQLVRSQQHAAPSSTVTLAPVPTSPKSRALMEALTYSPASGMRLPVNNQLDETDSSEASFSEVPAQAPSSRMQHNIPHRFQLTLCMRGVNCAACLDSVHFGRYASRCQECHVVCHPKCSTSIPSTCGVPEGYVRHFSDTVVASAGPNVKFAPGMFDITFDTSKPQGWVKVPRAGGKQGWERCFIALRNDTLFFLDDALRPEDEDVSKLQRAALDVVPLCPQDGEAVIASAVSATELMGTAKSDLPYVLKVELKPRTTCWPHKCLYIMVPTFAEKQLWVSVLEESARKSSSLEAPKHRLGDTVVTLQGDAVLDVNCTCEISFEYLLLGAMEGLFVIDLVRSALRRQVKGVPAVFQVGIVARLNVLLTICGQERKLKLAELAELQPWVETASGRDPAASPPTWRSVDSMEECHLFAHSEDAETLCVATANSVYILTWNPSSKNYFRRKTLSTNEPCSCLHFTHNSVLVGTDLFYEVNLADYRSHEFLDAEDSSLAFLVYGATQLRSFPVSILQVAPAGMDPEYLLCFHEMGVFVDSEGRRTRENDLKWTRLPLAFAYKVPYLFVGHFNSVEIIEVKPPGSKEGPFHQFVEVSSPRFLGLSSLSGCMYLASLKDKQMEVICVNAKATATGQSDNHDQANEDCANFSFTSSLEESLEE